MHILDLYILWFDQYNLTQMGFANCPQMFKWKLKMDKSKFSMSKLGLVPPDCLDYITSKNDNVYQILFFGRL